MIQKIKYANFFLLNPKSFHFLMSFDCKKNIHCINSSPYKKEHRVPTLRWVSYRTFQTPEDHTIQKYDTLKN